MQQQRVQQELPVLGALDSSQCRALGPQPASAELHAAADRGSAVSPRAAVCHLYLCTMLATYHLPVHLGHTNFDVMWLCNPVSLLRVLCHAVGGVQHDARQRATSHTASPSTDLGFPSTLLPCPAGEEMTDMDYLRSRMRSTFRGSDEETTSQEGEEAVDGESRQVAPLPA